jgi:hypothetical protein
MYEKIRVKEEIDRRYLGALLFIDQVTKGVVRRSLDIEANGLGFVANLSSLHVILSAAGLESHTVSFLSPPDEPEVKSMVFNLTISDPLHKFLPRTKRIDLPRNPDPKEEYNLFTPIEVVMFPAATASLSPNWSVIRASVFKDASEQPLRGSLLRLTREEDGGLIASGLTDQRGEALIIAAGIPVHNFAKAAEQPDDGDSDHDDWVAAGAVVEKETAVRLEVVVEWTLPWPVDPEELEENRDKWHRKVRENKEADWANYINLKLKTGQNQTKKLFVRVPEGT